MYTKRCLECRARADSTAGSCQEKWGIQRFLFHCTNHANKKLVHFSNPQALERTSHILNIPLIATAFRCFRCLSTMGCCHCHRRHGVVVAAVVLFILNFYSGYLFRMLIQDIVIFYYHTIKMCIVPLKCGCVPLLAFQ